MSVDGRFFVGRLHGAKRTKRAATEKVTKANRPFGGILARYNLVAVMQLAFLRNVSLFRAGPHLLGVR